MNLFTHVVKMYSASFMPPFRRARAALGGGQCRPGSTLLGRVVALACVGALVACGSGTGSTPKTPGKSGTPSPSTGAASSLGLRQIADIPVGGLGRFDYESLDQNSGRLYISHLTSNEVTVFDTKTQKVIGNIRGILLVHGVLAVPQLGRVYASATGTDHVVAIDAHTLKIVGQTSTGKHPDGIAYDPDTHTVAVSDETGGTVTIINGQTNQHITAIALGGEAGNTQYDSVSHRFFTAVQTRNQLVAIDPRSNRIIGRFDLAGCKHSHGLLIDSPSRLAFVTCDENATLLVVDLRTMHVISTQTVGAMPDVLAFDSGLHRLYVAAESGILTIFEERGTTVQKIAQGFIAKSAHSIAVDSQTHRVYLPLESLTKRPVLRILAPTQTGVAG